ncbi:MAG: Holliday junction resolvase RuvX [Oscillospiraceae bacterium]
MKIMAVDFGDARTGLAVCDRTEFLASPVGVVEERNFELAAMKVAHMAKEYEVGEIVVGLPLNMNGSRGPRAEKCERFATLVNELTDIPVNLWDERSTTVSAHGYLNQTNVRGKKRKEIVDAVAAVIILEGYLAFRRNKASKPQPDQ